MNKLRMTDSDALDLVLFHYQEGRPEQAVHVFEQILDMPPDDAVFLNTLSRVACRLGRFHHAEDLLQQAIRIAPEDFLYNNLGLLLRTQDRLDEAQEACRQAIGINPEFAEAHNNLGLVYKALGRTDEALACLRKAVAIRPDYAEAHNNLGRLLISCRKPDEAIVCFRKALEITPDYPDACCNLAEALGELGHLDGAVVWLEKAASLDPENPEIHNHLGIALKTRGDIAEAVDAFRKAVSLNPSYAEALSNLGNALMLLKHPDEAVSAYRRALAINPKNFKILNNMGIALKNMDRADEAVAVYRQAVEIKPDYAEAWYNLSLALVALERNAEAVETYQRVMELDPANLSAQHMLAALTGQNTEAAPGRYIERLFDQYCDRFDQHLTGFLDYQAPRKLREALRDFSGNIRFFHALDLGCGTGLAGAVFREDADRMTGVDLSAGMIEKAEKKEFYDALHISDIVGFLEQDSEFYDLFISADVLVYMGNLSPLFSAIGKRVAPGAWFVFSTEICKRGSYVLNPTGRYAHSRKYVESLAAANGFSIRSCRVTDLRKQRKKWVRGHVFVLQYMN